KGRARSLRRRRCLKRSTDDAPGRGILGSARRRDSRQGTCRERVRSGWGGRWFWMGAGRKADKAGPRAARLAGGGAPSSEDGTRWHGRVPKTELGGTVGFRRRN